MLEEVRFRPETRLRRQRRSEGLRRLLSETRLDTQEFVAPIIVRYGSGIVEKVESMPGVSRYSVDRLTGYVEKLAQAGVTSVLLFGVPGKKDEAGSGAYASDGVIPSAIRAIKESSPPTVVIADVCLCEYTNHGHCGVLEGGEVDNDRTLPLLARAAVQYAKAGADIVAPSAMMDGQVGAIRRELEESGYGDRLVMGYSAKYASSFYGPFREAAESSPAFGDRKGYQMNPPNAREAIREIELDVKEGADIIMVKPALAYLDVIAKARSRFNLPLAAYSVSGEYSMIKSASISGWIDERTAALEVLTAIRRAGADIIITYYAEQAARWIREMG